MTKLSKKTIDDIKRVSVMGDVLRESDPNSSTHGHWSDFPPDSWCDSEKELFDILSEHETKLKNAIYKILGI